MESSSAMSWALTLPEILNNIFDQLENDSRALAAASLVNQAWFSSATDVLWKMATWENLLQVPEDRQQIYAAKMTTLSFAGDNAATCHARFQHLQFSSLKSVSLDAYRPQEGGSLYHIRQYLQPPLERFAFYGGDLDEELLDHLRQSCWRLQQILIDSPGPKITEEFFSRFIAEYTSLRDVRFMFGMDHLISDELLLRLANRDALSGLAIGRQLSQGLLDRILADASSTPFKELKSLVMNTTAAAVPALVKVFAHISSLELDVQDGDGSVVKHLCHSLPGLKRLGLSFSAPTKLAVDDLLSLKALSRLEFLAIGPNEMVESATVDCLDSGFSDADFDDVFAQLPCLRMLDFTVQSSLSAAAAFLSLSKHCRMLEECILPLVFDLETLKSGTVMFPKLRELGVGGFEPISIPSDNDGDSADGTIDLLRRQLPNLRSVYVNSDDDFSNFIANSFSE
ncbi:hypothetical protein LLEC1_04256 [Akanthomyces lecanii]|uniref:F-box domain-containing protein n=1 Tax=Cordyceps confragosa TaxID=2714763 RepID=A0A179IN64_CORDF|nr:hypothetical protein LLEC1_04256 [Akanthomyces lecanii]